MNYEDRITKEYVEQQLAGYARVIAGTYLGDGTATRRIDLGVPLKAAIILMYGRQLQDGTYFYGGIASDKFTTPGVAIADTELVVGESGASRTNLSGVGYYYIAFC